MILNDSSLGKEFSSNALHELFNNKQEIEKSQDINNSQHKQLEVDKIVNNQLDSSFNLSLFEQHGEDWENENLVKRKEAGEKRRLRRGRRW